MLMMRRIVRRKFVYREHWDAEKRRQYLWMWSCQDHLLRTCGIAYCSFCIFFVAMFLANVAEHVATGWCIGAAFVLLQHFVLVPFIHALFLALASTVAIHLNPELLSHVVSPERSNSVSATSESGIKLQSNVG